MRMWTKRKELWLKKLIQAEREEEGEKMVCTWVGEWWSWQAVPYLETIRDGMVSAVEAN